MNKPLLFLLGAALTAPLSADTRLTSPAAASIVGAAPFFSDVRVFNTSYSASIEVTATYRCFLGACPAGVAQEIFLLTPRESRAFNDMVVSAFEAPNSAGGVELEVGSGATAADIVVTSRLYSTSPVPTVGMFVPGLPDSAAHRYAVLPQIANASGSAGFRTNVGAFNGEDVAASVTFAVYNGGAFLGQVQRPVPAHSGVQINNIFGSVVVLSITAA